MALVARLWDRVVFEMERVVIDLSLLGPIAYGGERGRLGSLEGYHEHQINIVSTSSNMLKPNVVSFLTFLPRSTSPVPVLERPTFGVNCPFAPLPQISSCDAQH